MFSEHVFPNRVTGATFLRFAPACALIILFAGLSGGSARALDLDVEALRGRLEEQEKRLNDMQSKIGGNTSAYEYPVQNLDYSERRDRTKYTLAGEPISRQVGKSHNLMFLVIRRSGDYRYSYAADDRQYKDYLKKSIYGASHSACDNTVPASESTGWPPDVTKLPP